MIRILQVIDKMDINSGVYSMLMNYYKYINNNKIIFDFIIHEALSEEIKKLYLNQKTRIFELCPLTSKNLLKNRIDFINILEKYNYKVIHVHLPNAGFLYLSIAKKYGVPIRILHSHNSKGSDIWWKNIRNGFLNKLGILYANKYFSCSKKAAEYLFGEKRLREGRVEIINNAIEIDKFLFNNSIRIKLRNNLNIDKEQFVIGHVGRMSQQKNHFFLIDIFKLFHNNNNCKLVLVGDGELKEKIESYTKINNLSDSVIFLGSRDDVNEVLQIFDVFVLPSLFEGLPVVSIEAQAAGLKCLLADTITSECNLTGNIKFLPLDNKLMWVTELEYIMNNNQRYNCKKQIRDQGFYIVREANKLEKYYIKAVSNI